MLSGCEFCYHGLITVVMVLSLIVQGWHVPANDMVILITCSREKHSVDIILSVSTELWLCTDVIDCSYHV